MGAAKYQVIYKGEILAGHDKQAAVREAATILSLSVAQAAQLLNGKRAVLQKGLDEATARSQCIRLKKAGLRVALGVPESLLAAPGQVQAAPAPAKAKTNTFSAPSPAAAPAAEKRPAAAARQPAINAGAPVPVAVDKPSRVPFEFHGSGGEYFRIWIVNVLLTIVTLGIYSAWAKVRNKQYFYGNTQINGAGFEYLASPKQIMRGRAVVGLFLIVYNAVRSFVPFAEPVFGLAFVFLFPWLMVRSLAFNAANSAWRNIRFGFSATYGEAFKVYILWPMLAMLTLGILSPYVFFRQRKFLVEHSSYGQTRFSFTATAKDYYRIVMLSSLLGLLAVALVGVAAYAFPPLAILALPIYLYAYAYFAAKSGNLLYNSSRLGRHRLQASMQVKSYMMLMLTNTLATALTLGFFHPWAKVRTLRYRAQHLALMAAGDLDSMVAEKQKKVSAVGDASSDFFNFDLGI